MRAVIQRVQTAQVLVADRVIGQIGSGLAVLLGVSAADQEKDASYLVDKLVHLRVFEDGEGKMNYSALDLRKEILVVSQFTLYGDCRKGRRPSFTAAADPPKAEALYLKVVQGLRDQGLSVATGQFQATMRVDILNDGPVTLLLDSQRGF